MGFFYFISPSLPPFLSFLFRVAVPRCERFFFGFCCIIV